MPRQTGCAQISSIALQRSKCLLKVNNTGFFWVNNSPCLQMAGRSVKWLFKQSLPGGNRNSSGSFNNLGNNGNWWSSSENSGTNAWNRNLNYDNDQVNRNNNNKTNGFSVRCLKHWLIPPWSVAAVFYCFSN